MARSKSSNQWMQEHINDEYVKKAKALGYRSRATFKLIEIIEKRGGISKIELLNKRRKDSSRNGYLSLDV